MCAIKKDIESNVTTDNRDVQKLQIYVVSLRHQPNREFLIPIHLTAFQSYTTHYKRQL
jgi:hypothetical protein